jgi:hypothetical protein
LSRVQVRLGLFDLLLECFDGSNVLAELGALLRVVASLVLGFVRVPPLFAHAFAGSLGRIVERLESPEDAIVDASKFVQVPLAPILDHADHAVDVLEGQAGLYICHIIGLGDADCLSVRSVGQLACQ